MASSKYILTLGLPVYNGENYIIDTLESIYANLSNNPELQEKVEILICNNASEDQTENQIMQYQKKLHFNYHKHDRNIGYDKNIDSLVQKAQGQYVWFIGCGEKIKKDALNSLCEILKNQHYTNLILNFDIFCEEQGKITEQSNSKIDKDIIAENILDRYSSAVSANIVNTQIYMQIINIPLEHQGWCHVERIIMMITKEPNPVTKILHKQYFTLLRDINGWWKNKTQRLELGLQHIKIVKSIPKKTELPIKQLKQLKQLKKTLDRFYLRSIIFAFSPLLAKRGDEKIKIKLIYDWIKTGKGNIYFWVIALPSIIMPRPLILLLKPLYLKIKAIKNSLKN